MKELKITQCSVGKYNWADPSEESLSFYMGIYEDGKIIEEGKNKAQLYYGGDPSNLYVLEDAFNRMCDVFYLCYENANSWISSKDYMGDCLLFAKIYTENIDVLEANLIIKETERIDREIAALEKEKQSFSDGLIHDISDDVNSCINQEIKKYSKWVDCANTKLADLKEGSESWIKENENKVRYEQKIAQLEARKLPVTA